MRGRRFSISPPLLLLLLLIPFLTCAGYQFKTFDSCKMNCATKEHLLCKFKRETAVGGCTNIRGEITPVERGHILALHNIHRDKFPHNPAMYDETSPYFEPAYNLTDLSIIHWADTIWAWRLETPLPEREGLATAQCMRQLLWDYRNEKAAEIYAQQCTTERYDCITEFTEDFPQMMSIFTQEGIHGGKQAMQMAFDHWVSSNSTMKPPDADDPYPRDMKYRANGLDDYDYTNEDQAKFLDWANIVYWRTFMMGCGKAHFQQNGKDWTRIVCIYGPGVNYIPIIKAIKANDSSVESDNESPSALYVDGFSCYTASPNVPNYLPSCPHFKCECRKGHYDFLLDLDSSWPWLCANDCAQNVKKETPIPSFLDYLNSSSDHQTIPLLIILLSLLLEAVLNEIS